MITGTKDRYRTKQPVHYVVATGAGLRLPVAGEGAQDGPAGRATKAAALASWGPLLLGVRQAGGGTDLTLRSQQPSNPLPKLSSSVVFLYVCMPHLPSLPVDVSYSKESCLFVIRFISIYMCWDRLR